MPFLLRFCTKILVTFCAFIYLSFIFNGQDSILAGVTLCVHCTVKPVLVLFVGMITSVEDNFGQVPVVPEWFEGLQKRQEKT